MRIRRLVGIGALEAMVVVACSSSSSSGPYTGPRTTECSSGPPRQALPAFGSPSNGELPTCVPRCGATMFPGATSDSRYSIAALPSGACAYEGEACQMSAGSVTTCPELGSVVCDLSGFECRCTGGSWECITTSQGGGLCPCDVDAAAHADGAAPDSGEGDAAARDDGGDAG